MWGWLVVEVCGWLQSWLCGVMGVGWGVFGGVDGVRPCSGGDLICRAVKFSSAAAERFVSACLWVGEVIVVVALFCFGAVDGVVVGESGCGC